MPPKACPQLVGGFIAECVAATSWSAPCQVVIDQQWRLGWGRRAQGELTLYGSHQGIPGGSGTRSEDNEHAVHCMAQTNKQGKRGGTQLGRLLADASNRKAARNNYKQLQNYRMQSKLERFVQLDGMRCVPPLIKRHPQHLQLRTRL